MAMLRFLLVLFLIPICLGSFAQISGVVVDAATRKPIPYVNIGSVAEGFGTSCSAKGKFRINARKGDSLIFSAVGFKAITVAVNDLSDILEMEKQVAQLQAVEIRPGAIREIVLGRYPTDRVSHYWGAGDYPLLVARYFPYPKDSADVLLLNRLRVYTKSKVRKAKFNVRIYSVGEGGAPSEYLCDQNVFGYARKGRNQTEVDLSGLRIVLPKEGLFIAVESLRIDENAYTETMKNMLAKRGDPVEVESVRYAPSFGRIPKGRKEWGWTYFQGRWQCSKNEKQIMPGARDTPLAVELVVMD
jgi:hypothetical protein